MFLNRRTIGVMILFVISAALTAFWNSFASIIYDFAANLYFAGFATVAVALPLHLLVIRRLLTRNTFATQWLGVAISGVVSILIYEILRGYSEHYTYLHRDAMVDWGDEGRSTGLGHYALGFHWLTFLHFLPTTLSSACIYGVVWLPCLVCLEQWSYRSTITSKSSLSSDIQNAIPPPSPNQNC
jgi:hypothetical protein